MRKAKVLQHSRNYGNISIQNDLTKKQMKIYYALKGEAREEERKDRTGKFRYRVRGPPDHWNIVKLPKNY